MKTILRNIIIIMFSLWCTNQFIPGLKSDNEFLSFLITAIIYGIFSLLLRPILKLITLPLTILTFGLASLLISPFLLFLTFSISPWFSIHPWVFDGITIFGISLPTIQFGIIPTYCICAYINELIIKLARWLTN